ncbi:MAG: alternative ribosome rescue aminoacyl-tRNA hydrolase ArfB [Pseudomonadota bacterium]
MRPLLHLMEERFIRASGPGGQNVNKVSTAVQLTYKAAEDPRLTPADRQRLARQAGHLIDHAGTVHIEARTQRTQSANRREARERLQALLEACRHVPKARTPTRPSLGSKRRRLDSKTRRGQTKQLRRAPRSDDG